jgi:hypothetical protein
MAMNLVTYEDKNNLLKIENELGLEIKPIPIAVGDNIQISFDELL